jgi:hypothetical protein
MPALFLVRILFLPETAEWAILTRSFGVGKHRCLPLQNEWERL